MTTVYIVGSGAGVFNPKSTVTATIECWGGGQAGQSTGPGAGGAGAGYAKKNSFSLTANTPVNFSLGTPGSTSLANGGDTWFSTSATIIAAGGNSGTTQIGDVTNVGGAGGGAGNGAGGGAGGPDGAGLANSGTTGGAGDNGLGGAGGTDGNAGSDNYDKGGGGAGHAANTNRAGTPGGGGGSGTGPGGFSVIKITYASSDANQLIIVGTITSVTIPKNWTYASVECWGGGGGANPGAVGSSGGGGGGGAYAKLNSLAVSGAMACSVGLAGGSASNGTATNFNGSGTINANGGTGSTGTAGGAGGTTGATGDVKNAGGLGGSGGASGSDGAGGGGGAAGIDGVGVGGANFSGTSGGKGGNGDNGTGGVGPAGSSTTVNGVVGGSDARGGAGAGGAGTLANGAAGGFPGGGGSGGGGGATQTAGGGSGGQIILTQLSVALDWIQKRGDDIVRTVFAAAGAAVISSFVAPAIAKTPTTFWFPQPAYEVYRSSHLGLGAYRPDDPPGDQVPKGVVAKTPTADWFVQPPYEEYRRTAGLGPYYLDDPPGDQVSKFTIAKTTTSFWFDQPIGQEVPPRYRNLIELTGDQVPKFTIAATPSSYWFTQPLAEIARPRVVDADPIQIIPQFTIAKTPTTYWFNQVIASEVPGRFRNLSAVDLTGDQVPQFTIAKTPTAYWFTQPLAEIARQRVVDADPIGIIPRFSAAKTPTAFWFTTLIEIVRPIVHDDVGVNIFPFTVTKTPTAFWFNPQIAEVSRVRIDDRIGVEVLKPVAAPATTPSVFWSAPWIDPAFRYNNSQVIVSFEVTTSAAVTVTSISWQQQTQDRAYDSGANDFYAVAFGFPAPAPPFGWQPIFDFVTQKYHYEELNGAYFRAPPIAITPSTYWFTELVADIARQRTDDRIGQWSPRPPSTAVTPTTYWFAELIAEIARPRTDDRSSQWIPQVPSVAATPKSFWFTEPIAEIARQRTDDRSGQWIPQVPTTAKTPTQMGWVSVSIDPLQIRYTLEVQNWSFPAPPAPTGSSQTNFFKMGHPQAIYQMGRL